MNAQHTDLYWFALPSCVWYQILQRLPVTDVTSFGASCKAAWTLTLDDIGVWKQRCLQAGLNAMLNSPALTYYSLFKHFLYKYGNLVGKWRTEINGIGAVLLITLDGPRLRANSVGVTPSDEEYKLQPFFEVLFAEDGSVKIHCKHFGSAEGQRRDGDGSCSEWGHAAELEWQGGPLGPLGALAGPVEGPSECGKGGQDACEHGVFQYCCQLGCRHDLRELHARLLELPQGAEDEDGAALRRRSMQLLQSTSLLSSLSPAPEKVTFTRFKPPSTDSHPLAGLWRCGYGDNGIELVMITPTPLLGDQLAGYKLVAEKVTGDVNVPAGRISFWFTLSAEETEVLRQGSLAPQQQFLLPGLPFGGLEVDLQANIGGPQAGLPRWVIVQGQGQGVVALPGYRAPDWVDIRVSVFDGSSLGVHWPSLDFFTMCSRLVL